MTTARKVLEATHSISTLEGAGVHLKRGFGFQKPERYDPFLLFDDFRSNIPEHFLKGFPWHPHRGIETITYVLQGEVEHGDSLGNMGIISDGDVQWMTAGSGIIHQEMPKGTPDGIMHGFQLWLNLPLTKKMCAPKYRDVSAGEIALLSFPGGAEVKIICGEIEGIRGPVQDTAVQATYLDISLPKNSSYSHPTQNHFTAIAYVIEGSGRFCNEPTEYADTSLILFSKGDELTVETGNTQLRFLLMTGEPLQEPIAWQGPIVMNTQEELELAFKEYQEGNFIKNEI